MGRTKFDERTGANTRTRSASNCSSAGSGDELSGPFKSYDYKQSMGLKRSAQGCAWTSKTNPNKMAKADAFGNPNKMAKADPYGAWGQTFKSEANFKQMHWC